MKRQETIAAISTACVEAAIGIVRMSGPASFAISEKLFKANSQKKLKPRQAHYGSFVSSNGEVIDNGILLLMKAPFSYTGEDMAEFHCHGSPLILKKLLLEIINNGARPANAGEFTKRAFLNNKLDLAQAEAVIDVIRAETDEALISARARLQGVFSKKISSIKEALLAQLVRIEAELDFPEDEVEGIFNDELTGALDSARDCLEKMLCSFDEGRALKEGVRVLILGRPNAGKSSLLNILLQEERAIVTDIPGTTRDIIEETLNIRGLPVRLMDTAGLRHTDDQIEAIGVKLAKGRIDDAQLIIFVIDASAAALDEDLHFLTLMHGKKIIIAANKDDLIDNARRELLLEIFKKRRLVFISALKERGIEELKDAIYEETAGHAKVFINKNSSGELVVSVRHRDAIKRCLEDLGRAETAINKNMQKEFIAADLRRAIDSLAAITGEVTTEDILERIFEEFCIGK